MPRQRAVGDVRQVNYMLTLELIDLETGNGRLNVFLPIDRGVQARETLE